MLDAVGGPLRSWLDSIENKKRYKWVQRRRRRQRRKDAMKLIRMNKAKEIKFLRDRKRVDTILRKRGQMLPSYWQY